MINDNLALTNIVTLVAVYKEHIFWLKHCCLCKKEINKKNCAITTVFSKFFFKPIFQFWKNLHKIAKSKLFSFEMRAEIEIFIQTRLLSKTNSQEVKDF